ncbi:MAG: type II toxin-antitoxin system RelE/ParE family toxin [Aestuariivirga sp.]
MKPVIFLGDSLKRLKQFPEGARIDSGRELRRVQEGKDPREWKPMSSIGRGVREIRVADRAGAFRVIYVGSIGENVYVLHAFQKKTQKTSQPDLGIAKLRYKLIGK